MEIDRRDLLTGIVTTAAAATMPTFAVGAARRFYFPKRLFFSRAIPWDYAVTIAHYDSRWHYDPNLGGPMLIRHEGSGLTFRRAHEPLDPFVMEAVFIDDPLEGWPDAARITSVGRAAIWTFLAGHDLRYRDRRKSAFYFRYSWRNFAGGSAIPPYVEDAPALF